MLKIKDYSKRLTVEGPKVADDHLILTREALNFIGHLEEKFGERRRKLLDRRQKRQREFDNGVMPDFLPGTKSIRDGDWQVAPQPRDLLDRRVEITGPTSRKMVINALNSGAYTFMADFEDSNCPTWENMIDGQINMMDAVRRTISYQDPKTKKEYKLNDKSAVLLARPRGLHLEEYHVFLDGLPISGSLFDFGMYFFHNIRENKKRGTSCYYYLPKMESYMEARWWNDVFVEAQSLLDLPLGTIKATVLIETLMAAFEMDEILFSLREHSAGLNCGRWDYMFSFVKNFSKRDDYIFPDRAEVTMTVPNMRAYCLLVIQTCHKRGAPAIGGMAAQIPIKDDEVANKKALDKVRADKEREVSDGHDGTWVAHPGLVPIALEAFNKGMPGPNQINRKRDDVNVNPKDLITMPDGQITTEGLQNNIDVGLRYLASWLSGQGCVPIHHLMEDAATAEISRAQVWQWVRNGVKTKDGTVVTRELVNDMIGKQLKNIEQEMGRDNYNAERFEEAKFVFTELCFSKKFIEFLTLPAYQRILEKGW
ncbi:MAG: malate synthase A [Hydrotalea sp.]|nr:malate synthase A [Hydrotalea sp.]